MSNTINLLLVEDETDVLEANYKYLIRLGYNVFCAETLEKARKSLQKNAPDLILLDIMLPDGSGFEFCKEIRRFTTVPIIFLTAMGDDGNVIDGLTIGGDDYIVKPYRMEVMGARIAARLRRHGVNVGLIELPPLCIDIVAGKAKLHEQDLRLSPKEFQMLVYLAENRGMDVSQMQIFKAVWGDSLDTMGNTVRMHISRLRRKMDTDGSESCFDIITTPNGYRFLQTKYPEAE